MDIPELEKIGLLKNDRLVYVSLLEIGSTTMGDLASSVKLNRSYIYEILDRLINLGLVSFIIKNNKKFFSAEDPKIIISIAENKKEEIDKDKAELAKILPLLMEKQKKVLGEHNARVFLGKEGIKSILEDILTVKKDFVAFGAEGKFRSIYKWYFTNWQKRRIQCKISYKIIYNMQMSNKMHIKEQKLMQLGFLSDKYESPATTIVYGNKTAILLWDNQPIGFVLESNEVAKSFLNHFDLLWKTAKK